MALKVELEVDIALLQYEKREALEIITNLYVYMQSSKFHNGDELDGYISTQDVFNRLGPAVEVLQD
jgi:hypothetical protein